MLRASFFLGAVLVVALRPFQPQVPFSWSLTYQALAHVFVGMAIGMALCSRSAIAVSNERWARAAFREDLRFYRVLVVIVTAVELLCFATRFVIGI